MTSLNRKIRTLWITNTIFPAPSKALGLPVPVVGGWMYGLAGQLADSSEIKLAVATIYQGTELKTFDLDDIRYYLLPSRVSSGYQKHLEPLWHEICSKFMPDVVHIHGTEFQHGLACMRACQALNYVISIQGLVGIIAKYYYGGLTKTEIITNITFRDILRWDTLFQSKKKFTVRGIFEEELIKRTKHIIGRTGWDYVHTKAINPNLIYHYCNETLRNGFYSALKWDVNKKSNRTIFLSQAGYPIKGLHQVLKAVSLLINDFPDIKIRIAGHNIIDKTTIVNRMKINGYGLYIMKLIKRLKLDSNVVFLGPLSEIQMIAEFQNANLFVCPSSVENSPNSIGEAQMLGVPTVASFVGGIPGMITHGESGLLYQFEEVEMLAENIRSIFSNVNLAHHLSAHGIEAAEQRHNQTVNRDQTINIYKDISKLAIEVGCQ